MMALWGDPLFNSGKAVGRWLRTISASERSSQGIRWRTLLFRLSIPPCILDSRTWGVSLEELAGLVKGALAMVRDIHIHEDIPAEQEARRLLPAAGTIAAMAYYTKPRRVTGRQLNGLTEIIRLSASPTRADATQRCLYNHPKDYHKLQRLWLQFYVDERQATRPAMQLDQPRFAALTDFAASSPPSDICAFLGEATELASLRLRDACSTVGEVNALLRRLAKLERFAFSYVQDSPFFNAPDQFHVCSPVTSVSADALGVEPGHFACTSAQVAASGQRRTCPRVLCGLATLSSIRTGAHRHLRCV
jgi:hypothetical protein